MTDRTYEIASTITVEVLNPAAVHNIAVMSGAPSSSDEAEDLRVAIAAGLNELPGLVGRYGFQVLDARADVVAK